MYLDLYNYIWKIVYCFSLSVQIPAMNFYKLYLQDDNSKKHFPNDMDTRRPNEMIKYTKWSYNLIDSPELLYAAL